ncbi:unnamed protein product, partial [marine sediment metagenome]
AANFTQRIMDMGYDNEEATLILNLLKRDIEEKENTVILSTKVLYLHCQILAFAYL